MLSNLRFDAWYDDTGVLRDRLLEGPEYATDIVENFSIFQVITSPGHLQKFSSNTQQNRWHRMSLGRLEQFDEYHSLDRVHKVLAKNKLISAHICNSHYALYYVPEKIRFAMLIEMRIEILHGFEISASWSKSRNTNSFCISRYKFKLRFWLNWDPSVSRSTNSNWDFGFAVDWILTTIVDIDLYFD